MDAVLVGYGEVGRGLATAFSPYHKIDVVDTGLNLNADADRQYDLMLVAIPYSSGFVETVKDYILQFTPKAIVVFSSVPVGTSRLLGAVHSPIEGRHDNMADSIKHHTRWIGGYNDLVETFFLTADLNIQRTPSPEATEFLKLASLVIYGINIEWARYCKAVADDLGFNYQLVKRYNFDYNFLVETVHRKSDFVRYNLDPPEGKIGGHCVLPSMRLLREEYPHPFIQAVMDFNQED